MHKLEIRPGVWMAYEDHWFGEPWTVPETVVMVRLDLLGPASRARVSRSASGSGFR